MKTLIPEDDNSTQIPSLLVPIKGVDLLLPTVSVAEMIPFQPPLANPSINAKNSPLWYLGNLAWRGMKVPMISIEAINGGKLSLVKEDSQIVVLNNTGVNDALPFLCFPTQGIPHLSRVDANEISEVDGDDLADFDAIRVSMAGSVAVIPDVAKLETACAELLSL